MAATGIICFIILLIIEYGVFQGVSYYIRSFFERELPVPAAQTQIDTDVDAENKRVEKMTKLDLDTNNLVVKNLSKSYGKFLAVNKLSLVLQRYVHSNKAECFGLIGANGAGKTSTIRMLTGDHRISSGEAYVRGIRLKNNMNAIQNHWLLSPIRCTDQRSYRK